jgi:hypothetical protein
LSGEGGTVAYDLMLMDPAGSGRARERAESIARLVHALPALRSCEVHDGFHEPDDLDCDGLAELLEEERAAVERFRSFCAAQGLDEQSARSDPQSAARFLDLEWGVILVTAKMPRDESDVATAYTELLDFARKQQLRLWDPQSGTAIDLANPGRLPPMWK